MSFGICTAPSLKTSQHLDFARGITKFNIPTHPVYNPLMYVKTCRLKECAYRLRQGVLKYYTSRIQSNF